MTAGVSLQCVLPWKALFMDERDSRISALPCCANWIKRSYGAIDENSSIDGVWNGAGAQEIRRLMIEGRQDELCAPDCPWLASGRFSEDQLRVIPGPPEFEENQRLNNLEISERRTVLASRPMLLRLIPTLRCNLRCRMCLQEHDKDVPLPEWFMGGIRALGPFIYDYQLHGGEVLVAGRLGEWAAPDWLARYPQILLSLVTNATVVPDRAWDILRTARINYITVSINAATRDTYRHMAGADLFDDVIGNVVKLRDLGRSHKERKFVVYISYVIARSNSHEVADFVQLANLLDVPFRLLLVVGDHQGESIYTSPPILSNVLDSVRRAEAFAQEESLPEVVRVRESLEQFIDQAECRKGNP